jgi:hypothetical protein
MAEYCVVLVLVSLGCTAAIVAVSPRLIALLRVQVLVLSLPAIY